MLFYLFCFLCTQRSSIYKYSSIDKCYSQHRTNIYAWWKASLLSASNIFTHDNGWKWQEKLSLMLFCMQILGLKNKFFKFFNFFVKITKNHYLKAKKFKCKRKIFMNWNSLIIKALPNIWVGCDGCKHLHDYLSILRVFFVIYVKDIKSFVE